MRRNELIRLIRLRFFHVMLGARMHMSLPCYAA